MSAKVKSTITITCNECGDEHFEHVTEGPEKPDFRAARLAALDAGWECNLTATSARGHHDVGPKCVAENDRIELERIHRETAERRSA